MTHSDISSGSFAVVHTYQRREGDGGGHSSFSVDGVIGYDRRAGA